MAPRCSLTLGIHAILPGNIPVPVGGEEGQGNRDTISDETLGPGLVGIPFQS